ncbi:hypothetical protein EYF80_048098 [Liparis tanakae]|uniref:Uncharacterized protein n=1 Tax=Liparis tanakae TaxID=230148 RepID=A0A4Z2FLF1_9TELE|nr:hypothetical protein EYF80_048098 [Liparis tanakae]
MSAVKKVLVFLLEQPENLQDLLKNRATALQYKPVKQSLKTKDYADGRLLKAISLQWVRANVLNGGIDL